MPQLRKREIEEIHFFFWWVGGKSSYSKRYILFIITCSTSEKTMTPFSPKILASSLHNIHTITSNTHPQNSNFKISVEMKEPDGKKRVRSYRRVESLMEPFRWACNSTFGIDTNHSIFRPWIFFFFFFLPIRLFMDLNSVLDFVVCFSYSKLEALN